MGTCSLGFAMQTQVAPSQPVEPTQAPVCTPVPHYAQGVVVGQICAERLDGSGLTLLNLKDDWTPRIFSETPEQPQLYRQTYIALANERTSDSYRAGLDRYFELFGIFPSVAVVRARLLDTDRHACHDGVADQALSTLERTLYPGVRLRNGSALSEAVRGAQAHLRCDGLLSEKARSGVFDAPTAEALGLFQRRHMLPSLAVLDAETRAALTGDSRKLDFLTLMRVLRERTADAAGLIEDGSARNAWSPILGSYIDPAEFRTVLRKSPMPRGAEDLLAKATETAAIALGWTSPEAAREALPNFPAEAAVSLGNTPSYHGNPMRLRVEIDRGDVWTEYPLDADGRPLPSPVRQRPTLVLYAETSDGELPLVRWPTTIGGWQEERLPDGAEELKYKASPAGRRYWRDMLVSPSWFPPDSTPDRDLIWQRPDGRWEANNDAVGPGYRSAYGLLALLHHRALATDDGGISLADLQIRTHGSGNYRSILRGSSHGCHRLFNHLALRLGSFLLAHVQYVRHGSIDEKFSKRLLWRGRPVLVQTSSRGYRFELVPPVPVDVLPGQKVYIPRPISEVLSDTQPLCRGES